MDSITCSAAFTSSLVYGDGPLTWLTVDHDVRPRVINDASHPLSNSRRMTLIPVEMALKKQLRSIASEEIWEVRSYLTNRSHSTWNVTFSLNSGLIFSLTFSSS
jgi:hypothetical protein